MSGPPHPAAGARRGRWKVWLGLCLPPLALAASFSLAAAFLVLGRGVPAGELGAVLQAAPELPAALGFLAALAAVLALARSEALSLAALGLGRPRPVELAVGAAAGAALWGLNAVALYPLLRRLQPSFDPTASALPLGAAVALLAVAIVAEEVTYRGYALPVLRVRHGLPVALAVTAAANGALAPGPELPLKVWALAFGLALGALRTWREDLWAPLAAHAVVSLGPLLAARLCESPVIKAWG